MGEKESKKTEFTTVSIPVTLFEKVKKQDWWHRIHFSFKLRGLHPKGDNLWERRGAFHRRRRGES